jgi:fyn-related kinase
MFFLNVISTPQDPMKRPTFETLQWKLEDFFTMSDSEYKDASAY